MIMPAFGGILIAATDTSVVFALCGAGFLTMFFVVSSLPIHGQPEPTTGSALQQIKEGLRFIVQQKLFLVLISLSYFSMFFGMSHMQLMPAFAKLLDAGEQGYGFLISATGVGSVIGTLMVGYFQHSKRLGISIFVSAALSGLAVACFALVAGFLADLEFAYYLAVITLMVGSSLSSMYMIASMTVLQQST